MLQFCQRRSLLCLVVALYRVQGSSGQPEAEHRVWQDFNALLIATAETELYLAASVEREAGRPTAIADLNNMLANAVQQGVSTRFADCEMEFSVAVWETYPPVAFRRFNLMRDGAGVAPYGRCERLPIPPPDRGYWPCREGGSVHGGRYLQYFSHKHYMIIFTPAWYEYPVSITNPDDPPLSHVFQIYEAAFETCIIDNWQRPLDLHVFSICISARFGTVAGFSGIRGLAAIPAQPTNELSYPKGGVSSPEGHVVGEHIKLRRYDTREVLFEEIGQSFKELWLVVGAPLRLDLC